jgi:hypothetical protein
MGILESTRLERIAFADADETALVEKDLADCILVGGKGVPMDGFWWILQCSQLDHTTGSLCRHFLAFS